MKLKRILFSTSILILFLSACATSMTPSEVKNSLPTLTNSFFYNQKQATEAIEKKKCKLLIKGRNYVAPVGFTVKNDLKNGATGIDEWVTVDQNGSTQLHIDFDTMKCE